MRLPTTVLDESRSAAAVARPIDLVSHLIRRPFVRLALRSGSLVGLFVLIDTALLYLSRLPAASYEREVIAFEAIRHLSTRTPLFVAALVGITALLSVAVWRRSIGPRWSDFALGSRLRLLVGAVAFLLTWTYATYEYNAYFDQMHLIDRLLLPLLVILLIWRPIFVLPFLWILLPIMQQFNYPIGGYSWAEQILLARILMLFGAVLLVAMATGRRWSMDFIFVTCCMFAAYFWVPGIGKIRLNWLLEDQVPFLLPATYTNGWLGFLRAETVAAITSAFSSVNIPMKIVTMVAEVGAIVCLWNRQTMRAFLLLWIGLHLGIVLLSGIFFWMWIVLEAIMLLLFFRKGAPVLPIFTRGHLLLSVLIIGGGALWFDPVKLAWKDSPLSYTYQFDGVGASGRTYRLSPGFFSPYRHQFTLGAFHYLSDDPHLMVVWGATSSGRMLRALAEINDPAEVFALERAMGTTSFHARRAAALEEFVRRTVEHRNRRLSAREPWKLLASPPQLLTFPLFGPTLDEPLERVVVHQATSFYDEDRYRVIRDREVRSIRIATQ